MLRVEDATPDDFPEIVRLLEQNGLPTADLETSQPHFVVVREGQSLAGAGALQRLDGCALLRSLVTETRWRGRGVAKLIVGQLETQAQAMKVPQIVLLTQTAPKFFEQRGYRVIDRGLAPAAALASEEFRALCPASAICMSKTISEHSHG